MGTVSLDMQAGIEPAHGGFAYRSVPISPLHAKVVWVRGSAPRPPASKAGTLLARASPSYLLFGEQREKRKSGAHGRTRTRMPPGP